MKRRVATRLGVVAVLGWIVLVSVLIGRSPSTGAPDPPALAAAVTSAYRGHDASALERLLAEPPKDAATRLLGACGGSVASARVNGADRIELVTPDGRVCGELPIRNHGGRWYADAWAAPLR